jgi:hypothetical protein
MIFSVFVLTRNDVSHQAARLNATCPARFGTTCASGMSLVSSWYANRRRAGCSNVARWLVEPIAPGLSRTTVRARHKADVEACDGIGVGIARMWQAMKSRTRARALSWFRAGWTSRSN